MVNNVGSVKHPLGGTSVEAQQNAARQNQIGEDTGTVAGQGVGSALDSVNGAINALRALAIQIAQQEAAQAGLNQQSGATANRAVAISQGSTQSNLTNAVAGLHHEQQAGEQYVGELGASRKKVEEFIAALVGIGGGLENDTRPKINDISQKMKGTAAAEHHHAGQTGTYARNQ